MIFPPHPTLPPKQTKTRTQRLKRKRCAASVRVEWWHFQFHSSDDDLIGGETKNLYLGRTHWYPGRKNLYPKEEQTDIQKDKTDIQEETTDIQEDKTDIQEEKTDIQEEQTDM